MTYRFLAAPAVAIQLALILVTAGAAGATNFTINATGDGYYLQPRFSPSSLTIHVGDKVTFTNASAGTAYVGMHNVHADDESFICSDSCSAPNNQPSSNAWSFTITFNQAKTLNFHCDMHGNYNLSGMSGTITVLAGGTPGSLALSAATYSAQSSAANASISVDRNGGTSGAVSVQYETSDGTAHAGTDYTAASGTLDWSDGDASAKSFSIPILHGSGGGTVNITLSSPGGGATLGSPSAAVLTIEAPQSAGTLGFAQVSPSVSEAAGSVAIQVNRTGGSSGAVAVNYATGGGTAVPGTNYTSTSGTLTWAAGDHSPKSFNVQVLDDHVVDGTHTAVLTLSNATGGASINPAVATLSSTDADASGSPPAAPSNLVATPLDTGDIKLSWTLNSTNQTGLLIQDRTLDGSYAALNSQPSSATATEFTVSGLAPAVGYAFHIAASNASGLSAYSNEAVASTGATPAPCVAGPQTLCLGDNGRFQVQVRYVAPNQSGAASALPLASNPDSGLLYFFQASNIEMLIKVLNACAAPFNRYWVFFAATTNVQFLVTVIDTQTGAVQTYFNPLNHAAAPVQDTSAFATCP
ncbi:MAG: fibronectin type III domain-containing protein [Acidobacteria bacterium]|nr:fibronectin type III domain-containing protein [Acidobacteriota bacterium]